MNPFTLYLQTGKKKVTHVVTMLVTFLGGKRGGILQYSTFHPKWGYTGMFTL